MDDPTNDPITEPPKEYGRRRFLVLCATAVVGGAAGGVVLAERSSNESGTASPQSSTRHQQTTTDHHGTHKPQPKQAAKTTTTPSTAPAPAAAAPSETPPPTAPPSGKWSDPATWGGQVPPPNSAVEITRTVILDVDVGVSELTIAPEGALVFDPAASRTLRTTGNVFLLGTLAMKPSSIAVQHTLAFDAVDELRYVGGGCAPIASDVGLWVTDGGRLDLAGTPRLAWSRATSALAEGSREITLASDPVGWQIGDELVITPTESPVSGKGDPTTKHDNSVIAGIAGRTITLRDPLRSSHMVVTPGRDLALGAEVLNLTRNVRIEGAPDHRAHIAITAGAAQQIRYTALRYLGPRQPSAERNITKNVLGRYMLHFHHCGDGSRGSIIEGVVAREGGNHAFVPHASHGLTFRDCISHDTFESAYWWDGPGAAGPDGVMPTNDLLYERCVASFVRCDPPYQGFRLTGFLLRDGTGNRATGCVAVGVQGNVDASGFQWPELPGEGLWQFDNCLAHNNRMNGIFTWQNTQQPHLVTSFTGYHNGNAGISHGAYLNRYRYQSSTLYGNAVTAVLVHALSNANEPMRFDDLVCDGAGISEYVVSTTTHTLPSPGAVVFSHCTFKGFRTAAVGIGKGKGGVKEADRFDFVDCTFEGNEFLLAPNIHPDSVIRVQDATHGALALQRTDVGAAELRTTWNARVSSTDPFAQAVPPAVFVPGQVAEDPMDHCM